ncbi:MAG: MATE family efflux transporter [Oscillibacter sp.]|jgi:putative MATE family efflux protein|nr:MATE family efflux transporter [Oscillibacter sp.]
MKLRGTAQLRDMTVGSPAEHILFFSLPLLAGNVLQQLYNMVDSWVVGNFVGDTALAAVGSAFPIIFLFVSLFIGLGIGSTVVISQFYGAGEMNRVRDAVDTAYTATMVLAVPISVGSFLLSGPILQMMKLDAAAVGPAKIYMQIVSVGLIGSIGYNTNAGILQGLGNSKTPLLFLSIATVLNIILDLLFVICFHWGTFGVALATIIAEWVSWVLGTIYINRVYGDQFRIRPLHWRADRRLLSQIFKIGLPAGIQNALMAVGSMAVFARVNAYGYGFTAGYNVANKIDCFAFLPIQSIANAATTYTGQNIGAGRLDRVKLGTHASMKMSILWSVIAAAVVVPLAGPLMWLFSKSPEVIASGVLYLRWVMPCYILFTFLMVLGSVMRGAGESVVPLLSTLLSVWLGRVVLCYFLDLHFGKEYMFACFGGGWLLGALLAGGYYLSGRWKRHGSLTEEKTVENVE